MHLRAPGRVYAAAGGGFLQEGTGYAESPDGGDTWTKPNRGLSRHYLWRLAVDPGDPDTALVSAARSPRLAKPLLGPPSTASFPSACGSTGSDSPTLRSHCISVRAQNR